jgi:hypothetical protein
MAIDHLENTAASPLLMASANALSRTSAAVMNKAGARSLPKPAGSSRSAPEG